MGQKAQEGIFKMGIRQLANSPDTLVIYLYGDIQEDYMNASEIEANS